MAQILVNNPADKAEQLNTVFLVCICLIMCVFGGCKAIRRLIEFSNEETDAVKVKAEKQLQVAKEVETIVNDVDAQFTQVKKRFIPDIQHDRQYADRNRNHCKWR